jgi:hypothetical protein
MPQELTMMWYLPEPDNLTFVQDATGLWVIGENGRRPPTARERWLLKWYKEYLDEAKGFL